jgi:hypothetical protein
MVKETPRSLRDKRKSGNIEVVTPPGVEAVEELDFESSYLSICCLVQSESLASDKLVNQSNILSKMLERLQTGTPKDIEELTLGAISGALTWVSSDIVRCLIQNGLVDFCHEVLLRLIAKGFHGRIPDRSAEMSLDVLRDLSQLEESVTTWLLERLEIYAGLAVSCPLVFPAITVKRASVRLIQTLVELQPRCFLPGLPESRLSSETLQGLFLMCNSPDTELACCMSLAGLELERIFGSAVVPTSTRISIDLIPSIGAVIDEACTFTQEPAGEEQLRLDQWRSKLRGLSTFVDHIGASIDELVESDIEKTDSIEDRRFFIKKDLNSVPIELNIALSKLFNFESLVESLDRFSSLIGVSETPRTMGVILADRDLDNVFALVGLLVKIRKTISFRLIDRMEPNFAVFAAKILANLITRNVDVGIARDLIREALDTVYCLVLSVASQANSIRTPLLENEHNLMDFVQTVFTPILKQSIEGIDNRHITDEDEDEDVSAVVVSCFQILQLVFSLGACHRACAESTCAALAGLSDTNITVSGGCWLAETMFIVFGEKDLDSVLPADWSERMMGIASFLESKIVKGRKNTRSDRAMYIQGTIENIKAFIQYKL